MHEMNASFSKAKTEQYWVKLVGTKRIQNGGGGVSLNGCFTVELEHITCASSLIARYLHEFKERLDKHVGEKFMENH